MFPFPYGCKPGVKRTPAASYRQLFALGGVEVVSGYVVCLKQESGNDKRSLYHSLRVCEL